MNLIDIQRGFNDSYNFTVLKEEAMKILNNLLVNFENTYLEENECYLPNGVSFKDLIVEYSRTSLIINNSDSIYPFFRIRINLVNPQNSFAIFWYDVEFNSNRELSDDYFGKY